jgi:hypothetical protein
VTEGNFYKVVGDDGVLATDESNGAVLGVPNGGSPAVLVGPLTSNSDEHNAFVEDYFKTTGLPSTEIDAVHANTMMAGGMAAGGKRLPDRLVGFSSVVTRRLGGVRVAESFAWARFNKDAEAVAEGVYYAPPSVRCRSVA